jgi:predicted PurR-regulated permease PerM
MIIETETDTETDAGEYAVIPEPVPVRRPSWVRSVLIALALASVLWYLYATRIIWPPIIAAFLIAVVLDPLVDRLENRGWKRGIATAAIFLIFFGSVLVIAMYAVPVLVGQSKDVSRQLSGMFQDPFRPNLVKPAQQILRRLHAPPAIRDPILHWAKTGTGRMSHMLEIISSFLFENAPNLIWLVVVPVLAFYALTDFHLMYAKGLLLVPRANRQAVQRVVSEVTTLFGKYVRGLLSVCTLNALATSLVLTLFQLPYALVLGFIAGALYAVPYIGPLLNVSMIGLLALVTTTPAKALGIMACIVLLHQVLFDQVITPRVLGRQVGLHPILAIIALMSGSALAGPFGMIIAVPLAASIQIIVVHLVPKLGQQLKLRPLEALERTVASTKAAHVAAEEQPIDDHFRLETVIENVE